MKPRHPLVKVRYLDEGVRHRHGVYCGPHALGAARHMLDMLGRPPNAVRAFPRPTGAVVLRDLSAGGGPVALLRGLSASVLNQAFRSLA